MDSGVGGTRAVSEEIRSRAPRGNARRRAVPVAALPAIAVLLGAVPFDPWLDAPPYARAVHPRARVAVLATVGELVADADSTRGRGLREFMGRFQREAPAPRAGFRIAGVLDGLGLYSRGNQLVLLACHEFRRDVGGPAGPLPAGARISELRLGWRMDGLSRRLHVQSGRWRIRHLFDGDPPAPVADTTRQLARLCSATLAGRESGFDPQVFFTGEEEEGAPTSDGRGGQAFAVIGDTAFALPRLGRYSKENVVPLPGYAGRTVLVGLEDADDPFRSQLYLYIGERRPHATATPERLGLSGGRLYVFAAADSASRDESRFGGRGAEIVGRWVEVDWRLDDRALDEAARAAQAFDFVRLEDGAAHPGRRGELYFATTGDPGLGFNRFGRLYRLRLDPRDPLAAPRLKLLLDGSEGVLHPDNIGLNRHGEIAICEDPVAGLAASGQQRDTRVWIYDLASGRLTPVLEVDAETARTHVRGIDPGNVDTGYAPGRWEFSGIIDAEAFLGRGAWILSLQAHTLRVEPVAETVEGGQLLQLHWAR